MAVAKFVCGVVTACNFAMPITDDLPRIRRTLIRKCATAMSHLKKGI